MWKSLKKKNIFTLELWPSTVGNLVPRRHLAISRSISVATLGWARDTVVYRFIVCRTVLHHKDLCSPNCPNCF